MPVRLLAAMPVLVLLTGGVEARGQDENPFVKLIRSKVKDEKKPLAATVEFKVKAGKEKEFEAAFVPFLEASRKEPGCVAFQLNRHADHPDVYMAYEVFRSVAAVEEHVKQTYTATLLKTIRPLQEGDAKTTVFTVP